MSSNSESLFSTVMAWARSFPRSVWYAVMIGLCLHIGGLVFVLAATADTSELVWGDGTGYVSLAERLVDGYGFTNATPEGSVPETFRLPGLPFLIAIFIGSGLGLTAYFFAITTVSAIVIPLCVYTLASAWFSPRIARVAVLLSVVEPLMVFNSWFALSEIPAVVISLLSLCALKRGYERNDWRYALLAGALIAAAVYVRTALVPIYFVALVGVGLFALHRDRSRVPLLFITGSTIVIALAPWILWMHAHTGVYALSGTGWRNVYTDYLASVRALEKGTPFAEEKRALKEYAAEHLDLRGYALNDPANSGILREYALNELRGHERTIAKLQAIIFISYFTHTDYYYRLARLGFLPRIQNAISPSQVLAREGFAGIPTVMSAMADKFFLPLFERAWALGIFVLAACGLYRERRNRFAWLIIAALGVGYITSSAIGTGVEGRLRVPLMPYYFMLVGAGFYFVVDAARKVITYASKTR